jgi:hypothetical protein
MDWRNKGNIMKFRIIFAPLLLATMAQVSLTQTMDYTITPAERLVKVDNVKTTMQATSIHLQCSTVN